MEEEMALEMGPPFPPEIFREILLKATAKSLLRCKSVCKDWYSLISDQHFIKTRYSLSKTNNTHHKFIFSTHEQRNNLKICPLYDVLFHKSVSNSLELENPLQQPQIQDVRIVGSCNGLLCIVEEWKETLFIYNPTTRRSNLLPSPQLTSLLGGFYGFGYDELSNDYKVVITETETKTETETETESEMGARIYSLNSGKWKEIGKFPWAGPFGDGKLLNGALHWAAGEGRSAHSWKIVSLDLANETFGEVLQPTYHEGYDYLELGVSGEWLCVLCNYVAYCVATVWVMKVYGVKDSWTMLASMPYPLTWMEQVSAPFCISEDGKLMLQFGRKLVVYDSKDSASSVIGNIIECLEACTVVESLVSPFGLAGNNDNED